MQVFFMCRGECGGLIYAICALLSYILFSGLLQKLHFFHGAASLGEISFSLTGAIILMISLMFEFKSFKS